MQNKIENITLIPGWMATVAYYKKYIGLEIWRGKDFPEEEIHTNWIVTHSLGAHFALKKWHQDKNKKFILVNPLLVQKELTGRLLDWIKFIYKENVAFFGPNILFFSLPFAIRKLIILNKIPLLDILKQIPKENLIIIRGRQDIFFCDDNCACLAKEYGIKLIEVAEAKHDWNKKFDEIIEKITYS